LPTGIEIGSTTIHRIVEQEGPFFEALKFFPTLTRELLDENRVGCSQNSSMPPIS
jgi:hypothetical protein